MQYASVIRSRRYCWLRSAVSSGRTSPATSFDEMGMEEFAERARLEPRATGEICAQSAPLRPAVRN